MAVYTRPDPALASLGPGMRVAGCHAPPTLSQAAAAAHALRAIRGPTAGAVGVLPGALGHAADGRRCPAGRNSKSSNLSARLRVSATLRILRRGEPRPDRGIALIETHTHPTPGTLRRGVLERFERDPGRDPRRLLGTHGAVGRLPLVVKCCGFRRNRAVQGRATGLNGLESLGSARRIADPGAFPDWRLFRRLRRTQAVARIEPGPAGLYLRLRNGDEERDGGRWPDRPRAEDQAMGQDEGARSGHAAFRVTQRQTRTAEAAHRVHSSEVAGAGARRQPTASHS